MTGTRPQPFRVLSVDPTTCGVGYAVLERRSRLVDWGIKRVKGDDKNGRSAKAVAGLLRWYAPDLLAVEDCSGPGGRRCPRVRALIKDLEKVANTRKVRTARIGPRHVREICAGSRTANKEQVARALAVRFPELERRLPPHRKPWMSEDVRMAIFDAVALAVACFDRGSVSAKSR